VVPLHSHKTSCWWCGIRLFEKQEVGCGAFFWWGGDCVTNRIQQRAGEVGMKTTFMVVLDVSSSMKVYHGIVP
jgi:hypothetical protein